MEPLKPKRVKKQTFNYIPTRPSNLLASNSSLSFESSLQQTEEELSLGQITPDPMSETDIKYSFDNPGRTAVPRDWVLPARASRPLGSGVGPRSARSRVPYKPGHAILAAADVNPGIGPILVGSNGKYYQQVRAPGGLGSSSGKSNNYEKVTASLGTSRQPVPTVISTRQSNNQTTHFMVPQNANLNPGFQNAGQNYQPLFNQYPDLTPIVYSAAPNANGRELLVPNANPTIGFVGYQAPTNLPQTTVFSRTAEGNGLGPQVQGKVPAASAERNQYSAPIESHSRNPPDIINVLADPQVAQTPIPLLLGMNKHYGQQPKGPGFKPSVDGAFRPPPPRVEVNIEEKAFRSPTPTVKKSFSGSHSGLARTGSHLHAHNNQTQTGISGTGPGDSDSSLENFAHDLGSYSPEISQTPQLAAGDSSEPPPLPPRNKSRAKPKRASVVKRQKMDQTKQVP